jgi:phosphonate transport system permease protein
VQDVLRAVPDFVWAIILVALIGLGPLTGALALALNITGILAKVYSELWDSVDERRYEQVRASGGRIKDFFYGIRPLASRAVQSFTLMRAECAIRNAAVIGAVGGGGLGAEIWYQIRFGAWDKVSTLILFTLALTLTADLASNYIRRQLRSDPNHPRAIKARLGVRRSLASLDRHRLRRADRGLVGLVHGLGQYAPARTAPRRTSWNRPRRSCPARPGASFRFSSACCARTRPAALLGLGDPVKVEAREAAGQTVSLFSEYPPWQFYRPAAWVAWEQELDQWFVWRVIKSSTVPLAMAIVGTLLGVLGAIALTYPHTLAFQLEPAQFTGRNAAPAGARDPLHAAGARPCHGLDLPRRARGDVGVSLHRLLRPGLVAGTIAIAIHTMGVLVRVFSESVDNIPYRRFEQGFAGSRVTCFGMVAAPIACDPERAQATRG